MRSFPTGSSGPLSLRKEATHVAGPTNWGVRREIRRRPEGEAEARGLKAEGPGAADAGGGTRAGDAPNGRRDRGRPARGANSTRLPTSAAPGCLTGWIRPTNRATGLGIMSGQTAEANAERTRRLSGPSVCASRHAWKNVRNAPKPVTILGMFRARSSHCQESASSVSTASPAVPEPVRFGILGLSDVAVAFGRQHFRTWPGYGSRHDLAAVAQYAPNKAAGKRNALAKLISAAAIP